MSRVTFLLLSCFMTLAVVVQGFQNTASHPDAQCVSKGYTASCDNIIHENGEVTCATIYCTGRKAQPTNFWYGAVSIGPAADGTVCNENLRRVCRGGRCVGLARGEKMPRITGENEEFYLCSLNGANPVRRSGSS